MATYQKNNDNDGFTTRHTVSRSIETDQPIASADRSTPMHSGHGAGENHSTADPLPPNVLPGSFEDEEKGERGSASKDSDKSGTDDVCSLVDTPIVANGCVGDVVHATNGAAR